jgi:acetolactate synthase-1/2/3 large subunit
MESSAVLPQIKLKASDYIAQFLHASGVRQVFELSGGMITHMLDSLHRMGDIEVVSMHHEQAAAFAADAVGRLTGIPGVAMATSGPGATNLLTGIGSCYFDSSPAVFITGQVNVSEQKGTRAIRQLGFQETDIVAMAGPITKAAWRVESAAQLPSILREAFALATAGRPGPVLIDIPMNVQRESIEASPFAEFAAALTRSAASNHDVKTVLEALRKSQRPLVLAGGGIRAGSAQGMFRTFVEQFGIPVVSSLMGLDLLPAGHPLRVGLIGSYGNRWANFAMAESDLILVLGSRLDIRQTGSDTKYFKEGRAIFHVDCEAGEINNRVVGCMGIVSELAPFLESALSYAADDFPAHDDWKNRIDDLRSSYSDISELKDAKGINPNIFMHALSSHSKAAGAYIVDVGQHQMWAAQSIDVAEGQRWITSGGMGSMGFALPAAIGATLACKRKPCVVIAGDGAFQCNLQELQTIVCNRLPIKIVIVNNGCHGMVRQFQESYFEGRYQSTLWGYSAPDFVRVAEAYGIRGLRIRETEQIEQALESFWADPYEPVLLDVSIDTYTNVYPKIAFGRPLNQMEPDAKPIEMEGT